MLEANTNVQNIEPAEIIIEKIDETNPSNLISNYIEKIKAKDIEQIKVYLGVLYFFVLAFLSITLLM